MYSKTDHNKLVTELLSVKADKERPSSYILIGRTTQGTLKTVVKHRHVCHADMQYADPGLYDEIITQTGPTTPENTRYLNALLVGPFKDWQQYITLHDGYAHVQQLDVVPANVLYNFCIAARFATEYPQWLKTICATDDPIKTYVGDVVENTAPHYFNTNHCWFGWHGYGNTCQKPKEQGPNVITGRMNRKKLSAPYKSHPSACLPCNIIWDSE